MDSSKLSNLRHAVAVVAVVACLSHLSGCLNPTFVNKLSSGSFVPLAPGDTPYVQVLVINGTLEKTIDVVLGFAPEYQGINAWGIAGIGPGNQQGFVLTCDVNQIGLGDPTDLSRPAMVITGEEGDAVNVPASAFPLTLASGRDFNCGDTVIFSIVDDRNNSYGIQIAPGRIDGSTQTGPFNGPDTFEIYQLLDVGGGTPGIPIN